MITFLKRLAGVEIAQQRELERFKKNLNGIAAKNRELDELQAQLDDIVVAVGEKVQANRSSPPNAQRSSVPEGMVIGGTEDV